jgi:hypothetical protein
VIAGGRCDTGVVGMSVLIPPNECTVRNRKQSVSPLESGAKEGDSPVGVSLRLCRHLPSNTEPEKFRVNLAGPPVKPKYYLMTDSGQVP